MSGTGEKDLSKINEGERNETEVSKKSSPLRRIERTSPSTNQPQTLEERLTQLQRDNGGIFARRNFTDILHHNPEKQEDWDDLVKWTTKKEIGANDEPTTHSSDAKPSGSKSEITTKDTILKSINFTKIGMKNILANIQEVGRNYKQTYSAEDAECAKEMIPHVKQIRDYNDFKVDHPTMDDHASQAIKIYEKMAYKALVHFAEKFDDLPRRIKKHAEKFGINEENKGAIINTSTTEVSVQQDDLTASSSSTSMMDIQQNT